MVGRLFEGRGSGLEREVSVSLAATASQGKCQDSAAVVPRLLAPGFWSCQLLPRLGQSRGQHHNLYQMAKSMAPRHG